MLTISLSRIHANPQQPRRHFDDDAIDTLAESIRTAGLMQPIVVRPDAEQGGHYEIVAGERRFRAATKLGLMEIPAVVHEIDDRTAAEWALVENLQREDLNPIERADAFDRLRSEFGLTHQEIADAVGLDRASISNHLRLRGLDPETLDQVRAGKLGMGHARALLSVE
ncbi:MAG: ParB/RepB/Spo0J family partition protein, partial [Phycisphaerales bacterium]